MMRVLLLLAFSCLCPFLAWAVTPVEKVITLLEDLKAEIVGNGQSEATTYDAFACFCKDTTGTKATAIKTLNTDIDAKAASLESDVASKGVKESELLERKKKQGELGNELADVTARCLKEAMEFEATLADLTKALSSLEKAITSLKNAKPSFLQHDLAKQVSDCLRFAETMGFVKNQKEVAAVHAFLQVDPKDPAYKFHSDGVIDTLESMKVEFTTKKTDTEGERDRAKIACDELKSSLTGEMGTNKNAMDQLNIDIGSLETSIADARQFLIEKSEEMTDEQTYMKDLTERCELRARDWDQRSSGRADEITALTEALAILKTGSGDRKSIQELDAVNNRSLFLLDTRRLANASSAASSNASVAHKPASASKRVPSFLQARSVARRALRGGAAEVQRERVVELLQQEGIRLHSQMLASLSSQIGSNPFGRVKQLIQDLIERLLSESAQEATKKGFCDTEIGKAETEREYRFTEITTYSAEIYVLDTKRKELELAIENLNVTIPKLYETLNETTVQRGKEKDQNLQDIKTAQEGVDAVKEAITILKVYYKSAAKAEVSLLASPVDEDTQGAGFSGAYRGKQESAHNIIGILEVIQSDFDRTARQTAQAEKEAQAAFVELERSMKVDIAEKEKTVELNAMELDSVKNKMQKKMDDLITSQKLLDSALKAMEDLKPMCIDTGMTFAERKTKREEEIAALKKAICFIDPEGVEAECAR